MTIRRDRVKGAQNASDKFWVGRQLCSDEMQGCGLCSDACIFVLSVCFVVLSLTLSLLILVSSSSAFPAISLGFTLFW